jgi:hypothetical protein
MKLASTTRQRQDHDGQGLEPGRLEHYEADMFFELGAVQVNDRQSPGA